MRSIGNVQQKPKYASAMPEISNLAIKCNEQQMNFKERLSASQFNWIYRETSFAIGGFCVRSTSRRDHNSCTGKLETSKARRDNGSDMSL